MRQIQIGELIDTLIEERRAETGTGLTEFIENTVSPQAFLSSRQISRIRGISTDFPEGDAVIALAKVIPSIGVLDPSTISNRLLLRNQDIWLDQERLIKMQKKENIRGQFVLIASAWQPPIGLMDDEFVQSIANNIEEGFIYKFLYPHSDTYPKPKEATDSKPKEVFETINGWIDRLRDRVAGVWYARVVNQQIDRRKAADQLSEFNNKLDESITYQQTSLETQFWMCQPSNYCIFYNFGLENRNKNYRFASFLARGRLVKESHPMDLIESSGWLYLTEDKYKELEDIYKEDVSDWKASIHPMFKGDIKS
jgi:hypothetical protein